MQEKQRNLGGIACQLLCVEYNKTAVIQVVSEE